MSPAQRTINPLHFEDLEPHRFEDLVRQLAYRYRSWRNLEATGRLGRDQGLDIRGVEAVTSEVEPELDAFEESGEQTGEETPTQRIVDEREWRIQCKRYKEIGPKLMAEIVGETIPNPGNAPYGLIVAAACDVSAETMAVFHQEALVRGATEAHLWTKAHLEDSLFLPENDHLLFAYFGISLTIRRRTQLQRIRESITLKRKLMRALKLTSVTGSFLTDVLVRDVAVSEYPYEDRVAGFDEMRCPPWHVGSVEAFHVKGLVVCRYGYDGWVQEDGSWDIIEDSARVSGTMGLDYRQSREEEEDQAEQAARWERNVKLQEHIPEPERKYVRELWLLPYAHILEVDPIGDPLYEGPHLYCRFDGDEGPYVGGARYLAPGHWSGETMFLDPEKRKPLFNDLGDRSSAG